MSRSRMLSMRADFSDLIRKLQAAERTGGKAIAFGLYDAAGVVIEAVKNEAKGLPYKSSTVSQIVESIGIAKFRGSGSGYDTSVGSDGYFSESGFPIPFFVNEIENGTSRIPARPFQQRAYAAVKDAAESKGLATAETIINEALNN